MLEGACYFQLTPRFKQKVAGTFSSVRYTQLMKRWVVTGAAGFVGSHLVETLIRQGHHVVGLDNLSSGKWENLEGFLSALPNGTRKNFVFVCEDIRDARAVDKVVRGADVILHHAAMASVPKSIENPREAHEVNVTGFLNVLEAARTHQVKRVVYASSSAVYGDHPAATKTENDLGALLSPYAASKRVNELYAEQYARHYGLETVGFRYFNIFGTRQDPEGAYAAVIPKWVAAIKGGQPMLVYGDGTSTRDFVHVRDVAAVNLQVGLAPEGQALKGQVFNICSGTETNLKLLTSTLAELWKELHPSGAAPQVEFQAFRAGDIYRSLGSAGLAQKALGFRPHISLREGLKELLL